MKPTLADIYARLTLPLPLGTILLMRMGDFYEAFGQHAAIVAKVCNLSMTKRAGIPMTGLPYHSLDAYASKLVRAGYKVAISEYDDPKEMRTITRVIEEAPIKDIGANATLNRLRELLAEAQTMATKLGVETENFKAYDGELRDIEQTISDALEMANDFDLY